MLHTLTTRIKADRFAKGKLLLSSTSRATVKVDDQTLISKATSDSLPTDAEAPLSLNPETVYDITVDLLSMPDDKARPTPPPVWNSCPTRTSRMSP